MQTTVHGHQGMIVIMRSLRSEGPFCRNCGLATYRRMTADTLVHGWWGALSVLITPVVLLLNLIPRTRLRRLAQPSGGWGRPLDPGRPISRCARRDCSSSFWRSWSSRRWRH